MRMLRGILKIGFERSRSDQENQRFVLGPRSDKYDDCEVWFGVKTEVHADTYRYTLMRERYAHSSFGAVETRSRAYKLKTLSWLGNSS
jgi:hypothetical protein